MPPDIDIWPTMAKGPFLTRRCTVKTTGSGGNSTSCCPGFRGSGISLINAAKCPGAYQLQSRSSVNCNATIQCCVRSALELKETEEPSGFKTWRNAREQ